MTSAVSIRPGAEKARRKICRNAKKKGAEDFFACEKQKQQHMHPLSSSAPRSRHLQPQVCISRPWLLHRREMPPASISSGLAPRRPPSIRQIHRYRASRARRGKSTGTGEGARPAAATSGPQIAVSRASSWRRRRYRMIWVPPTETRRYKTGLRSEPNRYRYPVQVSSLPYCLDGPRALRDRASRAGAGARHNHTR